MCRRMVYVVVVMALSLANSASADLIGHWTFDEGGGNLAADSSGNGHDATVYGDPSWIAGKLGSALEFDGSDDYVGTGQSFLSDLGQFTIVCWLVGDPSGASRTGLIGQNDCIEYGFISGNTIQIWTPGGGSLNVNWPFTDLDWHHIAAVGDGTSLVVYIDGEEVKVAASTPGVIKTAPAPISIGGQSPQVIDGMIDDVAIFNVALSEDDIKSLADKGIEKTLNVTADSGKITTTWGLIKSRQ